MRKVTLSMKEQLMYEVIKELVDHGGNKCRAAEKLNISIRHVYRLINKYELEGKAGFIHKNKGRLPSNSLPQELSNKIIKLYATTYQGFNFKHYTEKLNEIEGIKVSYKSVYNLLTDNEYYPPKEHKVTKRKRAKLKVLNNKPNISKDDLLIAINHELSIEDAHPRKPRAKYFGEEIQMDASIHPWFNDSNNKCALHLAIDNATGTIVGGYFDKQETLNGYYMVFKQILINYGIPYKFLTDNRTVFNYVKDNRKDESKDVLTQFGYACKNLGVQLETSSVSQYKGQIERANKTFQDRLVNELRLEGINTIDKANEYLINTFIPDFNKRFSLDLNKFISVFETSPTREKINLTLAILSPRVFDSGSCIKYKNQYYQAYNQSNELICFKNRTDCLVINTLDNKLFVSVDERVYALKKHETHKKVSEEFDEVIKEEKQRRIYIPPMCHPWRTASYSAQVQRSHQQHIYAG